MPGGGLGISQCDENGFSPCLISSLRFARYHNRVYAIVAGVILERILLLYPWFSHEPWSERPPHEQTPRTYQTSTLKLYNTQYLPPMYTPVTINHPTPGTLAWLSDPHQLSEPLDTLEELWNYIVSTIGGWFSLEWLRALLRQVASALPSIDVGHLADVVKSYAVAVFSAIWSPFLLSLPHHYLL